MRDKRFKLKGIQKKVAEKMAKSKRTIPHVTTIREVRMDKVIETREKMEKIFTYKSEHISYLSFIIMAVINSIKKYPIMNSSFDESENEIIIKNDINIGLAVAVEDKLVVPIIKNANCMDMVKLNFKINDLAQKS